MPRMAHPVLDGEDLDRLWEFEIRAHTIYACDELTRRINVLRPPELRVFVPQVDARLWVPFHRTHYPHHPTRTIYYC